MSTRNHHYLNWYICINPWTRHERVEKPWRLPCWWGINASFEWSSTKSGNSIRNYQWQIEESATKEPNQQFIFSNKQIPLQTRHSSKGNYDFKKDEGHYMLRPSTPASFPRLSTTIFNGVTKEIGFVDVTDRLLCSFPQSLGEPTIEKHGFCDSAPWCLWFIVVTESSAPSTIDLAWTDERSVSFALRSARTPDGCGTWQQKQWQGLFKII